MAGYDDIHNLRDEGEFNPHRPSLITRPDQSDLGD